MLTPAPDWQVACLLATILALFAIAGLSGQALRPRRRSPRSRRAPPAGR
jgi:hypothetical protein